MSDKIKIKVTRRTEFGKGAARQARRAARWSGTCPTSRAASSGKSTRRGRGRTVRHTLPSSYALATRLETIG